MAMAVLLLSVHLARKKNRYSPFTEKLLRSPGYTLGQKLDDFSTRVLEVYLRIAFPPILLLFLHDRLSQFGYFFLLALMALYMGFNVRKMVRLLGEVKKIRLGLDGEVYTGQELNYLMRQGAWVFHDIPYQYGNIDHLVVSKGGVFVVETKTVRKPADEDGKRQSTVAVVDGWLQFPHQPSQAPIQQAKRHAEHVRKYLEKKTGKIYPVTPVVALPGWFVKTEKATDCLVINPKRGGGLRSFVERQVIPDNETQIIANHIEGFARTVQSNADINDPDARKNFDFWLNRKPEQEKM